MNPSEIFKLEIERCLPLLSEDEWALSNARDDLVEKLEPYEAFAAISGILALANEQQDEYAFSSCCWLALQMAGKANTTEIPEKLPEVLDKLSEHAKGFGDLGLDEIERVRKWFRL